LRVFYYGLNLLIRQEIKGYFETYVKKLIFRSISTCNSALCSLQFAPFFGIAQVQAGTNENV